MPKPGRPRKSVSAATYRGKLAVRLRKLRDAKGMTVKQVAAAVGVELHNIYRWEAATRDVGTDALPALAKALGCRTPGDLFPPWS